VALTAAAVVVAALDLMVVALALVAQRFTRMVDHQSPALPVPQALQPQGVLGGQEIWFRASLLFILAQGVQAAGLGRLVVRAKLEVSAALDPVAVVEAGATTLLGIRLLLGLLQVHGLAVLLNRL
jgi:hypothetical protein